MRCVIEEYCSLPFIERERIYKKEIYEAIEKACMEKREIEIEANFQKFSVYPYKIVSDLLNTQSYLACYSKKKDEGKRERGIASFSMARMEMPKVLLRTFTLNKKEIAEIEERISREPAAFLVGETEEIRVKLTKSGQQQYKARIYSRPEKIGEEKAGGDAIYIFKCTKRQARNYFFSFGADAEVISPEDLRKEFIETYKNAFDKYNKKK